MITAGAAADRLGPRPIVVVALGAMTVGLAMLSVQAQRDYDPEYLYEATGLIGAGVGGAFPALAATVAATAAPGRLWDESGWAV
mmetsp:Transcript_130477/g.297264  ORF Transcript_130477/g.297264 Transcript_130477/m.297264 type:complete len:84 (+) Transcript_130477:2-253(+)